MNDLNDPYKNFVPVHLHEHMEGLDALNIEGGGCLVRRWRHMDDFTNDNPDGTYVEQPPVYLSDVHVEKSGEKIKKESLTPGGGREDIWVDSYKLVKDTT